MKLQDNGWPKGSTDASGPIFWLAPQATKGAPGGHAHFPAKSGPKIKISIKT